MRRVVFITFCSYECSTLWKMKRLTNGLPTASVLCSSTTSFLQQRYQHTTTIDTNETRAAAGGSKRKGGVSSALKKKKDFAAAAAEGGAIEAKKSSAASDNDGNRIAHQQDTPAPAPASSSSPHKERRQGSSFASLFLRTLLNNQAETSTIARGSSSSSSSPTNRKPSADGTANNTAQSSTSVESIIGGEGAQATSSGDQQQAAAAATVSTAMKRSTLLERFCERELLIDVTDRTTTTGRSGKENEQRTATDSHHSSSSPAVSLKDTIPLNKFLQLLSSSSTSNSSRSLLMHFSPFLTTWPSVATSGSGTSTTLSTSGTMIDNDNDGKSTAAIRVLKAFQVHNAVLEYLSTGLGLSAAQSTRSLKQFMQVTNCNNVVEAYELLCDVSVHSLRHGLGLRFAFTPTTRGAINSKDTSNSDSCSKSRGSGGDDGVQSLCPLPPPSSSFSLTVAFEHTTFLDDLLTLFWDALDALPAASAESHTRRGLLLLCEALSTVLTGGGSSDGDQQSEQMTKLQQGEKEKEEGEEGQSPLMGILSAQLPSSMHIARLVREMEGLDLAMCCSSELGAVANFLSAFAPSGSPYRRIQQVPVVRSSSASAPILRFVEHDLALAPQQMEKKETMISILCEHTEGTVLGGGSGTPTGAAADGTTATSALGAAGGGTFFTVEVDWAYAEESAFRTLRRTLLHQYVLLESELRKQHRGSASTAALSSVVSSVPSLRELRVARETVAALRMHYEQLWGKKRSEFLASTANVGSGGSGSTASGGGFTSVLHQLTSRFQGRATQCPMFGKPSPFSLQARAGAQIQMPAQLPVRAAEPWFLQSLLIRPPAVASTGSSSSTSEGADNHHTGTSAELVRLDTFLKDQIIERRLSLITTHQHHQQSQTSSKQKVRREQERRAGGGRGKSATTGSGADELFSPAEITELAALCDYTSYNKRFGWLQVSSPSISSTSPSTNTQLLTLPPVEETLSTSAMAMGQSLEQRFLQLLPQPPPEASHNVHGLPADQWSTAAAAAAGDRLSLLTTTNVLSLLHSAYVLKRPQLVDRVLEHIAFCRQDEFKVLNSSSSSTATVTSCELRQEGTLMQLLPLPEVKYHQKLSSVVVGAGAGFGRKLFLPAHWRELIPFLTQGLKEGKPSLGPHSARGGGENGPIFHSVSDGRSSGEHPSPARLAEDRTYHAVLDLSDSFIAELAAGLPASATATTTSALCKTVSKDLSFFFSSFTLVFLRHRYSSGGGVTGNKNLNDRQEGGKEDSGGNVQFRAILALLTAFHSRLSCIPSESSALPGLTHDIRSTADLMQLMWLLNSTWSLRCLNRRSDEQDNKKSSDDEVLVLVAHIEAEVLWLLNGLQQAIGDCLSSSSPHQPKKPAIGVGGLAGDAVQIFDPRLWTAKQRKQFLTFCCRPAALGVDGSLASSAAIATKERTAHVEEPFALFSSFEIVDLLSTATTKGTQSPSPASRKPVLHPDFALFLSRSLPF